MKNTLVGAMPTQIDTSPSRNHLAACFVCCWPLIISLMYCGANVTASAQTFTNLHSFTEFGIPNNSNSDGASPYANLIVSGNTLYGTASAGGDSSLGTVFAVNTDGTGFTNLHRFGGAGSDGSSPQAGLILSGDTLYGTAYYGGSQARGSVFKVNTNGTGFTTLYSFTFGSDGAYPSAGLVLSGSTLYGTASVGGLGQGTVFAINTDGTGFNNLHSFVTASDGAFPLGGLVLSGNTLYGTANQGGSAGYGTVFAVNTDGTGFTNLLSLGFGAYPRTGLILSGNTLYGTRQNGNGTVFAVNINGTGFTNLHFLDYAEGSGPVGGLILSGNTLYGTAKDGGLGQGTVFAVNIDGSGFTNLYRFSAVPQFPPFINSDGAHPFAGLVLSGNALYGTAYSGGNAGNGTIFQISLPPPPNQQPIVTNPIPDTNSMYGSAFTFTFAINTFSDPDAGQTLLYTASNLPPGINFDGPARTFSGTPAAIGTNSVLVTATDNGVPPLSTNDTFNIVVDKAQLTVSANNTNRSYGEADPAFTGTLVGVTNSDNLTVTFTTTATLGSAPGDYPITPALQDPNSRLGNYIVTTNLGVLTVNGVMVELGSAAGSLILCWPTTAAAFLLEYADDLTPPITWQSVTSGIATNEPNICLTVAPDAAATSRFFRLRLP